MSAWVNVRIAELWMFLASICFRGKPPNFGTRL